ncbi:MAG TPA: beta-ketoacyl reductase, partial [Actinophytocola sp.]|nr:beta-ketoacyl reductase [Actinophytocola sp.]
RTDVTGVVSLLAGRRGWQPAAPGVPNAVAATMALVQGLGDAGVSAPVWTVTSGAVAVDDTDEPGDPAQAALWGLGRVVALEHPDRWGGLVDVASGQSNQLAAALSGAEDQVAIRRSATYARRLHEHLPAGPAEWRVSGGTVLITGGTGGLGAHTARWVAARGAERIVLASRRGAEAPGVDALVTELHEHGVEATVVACDLTDRHAVAALLDTADAGCPLRMVVHAAGVSEIRQLDESTERQVAEVMAAKVLGARHLDDCLGDRQLDAFVVFSSIAGVWGSGGQSAYAAANAYLDELVAARRARGLAGTSVAWGPWAGAGMIEHANVPALVRRGVLTMPPDSAIAALERTLAEDATMAVLANIDWDRFTAAFTAARPSPLLAAWQDADHGIDQVAPATALRDRLAGGTAAEAEIVLLDTIRAEAAAVLGFNEHHGVKAEFAFRDIGFDSLTAVELRDRLMAATGLPLAATLVFDHPTVAALARHLADRIGTADPDTELVLRSLDLLDDNDFVAELPGDTVLRLRAVVDRLDRRSAVTAPAAVDLSSASAAEIFDVIKAELHMDGDR